MYSEKAFKNYIFWIQVKRFFIIIVLSILGAVLGVLIGKIIESAIQASTYNNYMIIGTTILFFIISLLLTSNTGKEVQDAYWKIAVLRKLTVIQKSIEYNNDLLSNGSKSVKEYKSHAKIIEENFSDDLTLEKEEDDNSKKSKQKVKSKKPEKIRQ